MDTMAAGSIMIAGRVIGLVAICYALIRSTWRAARKRRRGSDDPVAEKHKRMVMERDRDDFQERATN